MKKERQTRFLVGIDEVGRGPLAGPLLVCACKVAVDFDFKRFKGIKDSKQLSALQREKWFKRLRELKESGELEYALGTVSASLIDRNGLAWAIRSATAMALEGLSLDPAETFIRLDGALHAPDRFVHQETVVRGDEKIPLISAASILAKVTRDRYMTEQAALFPAYGFEKHKGYGTEDHIRAIRASGVSPLHRKSFCFAFL